MYKKLIFDMFRVNNYSWVGFGVVTCLLVDPSNPNFFAQPMISDKPVSAEDFGHAYQNALQIILSLLDQITDHQALD